MAKQFVEWLDHELEVREWTRAELARRSGVTEASLSLIYSGAREPGSKVCNGIAKAFKLPPENVYREAGIFEDKPVEDKAVKEIKHIYHALNEENKQDVLDYAKMRRTKQERETKKNGKRDRVP